MDAARRDERGESLIEILVTIVIMGIAISALVTGLAAASRGAELHRQQADASNQLLTAAEAVRLASYSETCSAATSYESNARDALPSEWKPRLSASVKYWNPAAEQFDNTCRELVALDDATVRTAGYTTTSKRFTQIALRTGAVNTAMRGMEIDFVSGPLEPEPNAAIVAVDTAANTLIYESLAGLPAADNKFDVLPRDFQRLQQVTLTMRLAGDGDINVAFAKRSQS